MALSLEVALLYKTPTYLQPPSYPQVYTLPPLPPWVCLLPPHSPEVEVAFPLSCPLSHSCASAVNLPLSLVASEQTHKQEVVKETVGVCAERPGPSGETSLVPQFQPHFCPRHLSETFGQGGGGPSSNCHENKEPMQSPKSGPTVSLCACGKGGSLLTQASWAL